MAHIDAVKAWSLLNTNRPVLCHDPKTNTYFSCWCGTIMTKEYALALFTSIVSRAIITYSMRMSLHEEAKHISNKIPMSLDSDAFTTWHKLSYDIMTKMIESTDVWHDCKYLLDNENAVDVEF